MAGSGGGGGGSGGRGGGGGGGGGSGGMGGGTDGGGDAPVTQRSVRVVSTPVKNVTAGEAMRYRVVASDPSVVFEAVELPLGATLDTSGNFSWTPSSTQSGPRRVAMKVKAGDEEVVHEFQVTVATARRARTQAVDPNAPEATSITVDEPLSDIRGAGVQIEPGSLIGTGDVSVSISALDNAPVPPSAVVRKVSVGDLKPVELGPSGTAFRKGARVQLPVSAEVLKRGRPAVFTIDPVSGAWEKVKFLAVDEAQGIATAEIEHFSTYVVAPETDLLEMKLSRGATGTACEKSLIVRTALSVPPGELPASFINGWKGTAEDLAGVLAALEPNQTLQVFLDVTAQAKDGPSERGWLLMAVTKDRNGSFRVTVAGSQQSGAFLRLPDTMSATDDQLLALLAGRKAHLIFNGLGALEKGVAVTAEISLYVVDGADADRPPLAPVNPVTRETFEATELANDLPTDTGFDKDCDQAPETDDMEPDGEPPPQIFGEPASPVRLQKGATATLKVGSNADDVTFHWQGSDGTLNLSATEGASTTITPSQTGVYRVVVIGARGGAQSRFVWDVLVDAPDTMAMNTPPEVKIASSAAVARVGEFITLLAVGRDKEQGALRFRWQSSDPAALPVTFGPRVPFLAIAPGDYKISCVANDGLADSAPATLVLTVLAGAANRPPEAPAVTPMSAMVPHADGVPAVVTLHARSVDPDGDPVTFDFVPDPSVSRAVSLTKSMAGDSAEVRSLVDGVFLFHVTAQDKNGATSPATTVRIQVLPAGAIMPGRVDADMDGHPAGADCNDGDKSIFPGAREICGNDVDENCDGRALTTAECDSDKDGDRFTTDQGDCDDNDPRRNPRMLERCDGLDNNCNGQIDELFKVGEPCYVGTGACRASGLTRCSETLGAVVCSAAQPGLPMPETCDMIDNDCNGKVDDVPTRTVGTAESCGACGGSCPVRTNTVAACVIGGCVNRCAVGYVDLDRDPANGCECRVTGPEICDGLDNDCSGRIDDGITEKVWAGEMTSLDRGVCVSGVRYCKEGQWVEERAARLPSAEVCDGLDNDCNGKVDELFDLLNDARNCGGCGISCAIGVKCAEGRCVGGSGPVTAPPPRDTGSSGQVQIGICPGADGKTTCVDLQTDPANCGGCGKACPEGMFCGLGTCVSKDKLPAGTAPPPVVRVSCPLPPPPASGGDAGASGCPGEMPDVCKTARDDLYCTNLRFDNASCGACGVACPAGAFCRDGRCTSESGEAGGGTPTAPTCREPFKLCSDPFGGSHCTDMSRDPGNCGGCGIVCGQGTFCAEGRCMTGTTPPPSACPPPTTNCGPADGQPYCTDLYRDPGNCGACGMRCGEGTYCREGTCVTGERPPVSCYPPTTTCKDPSGKLYCADTFHDGGNCGQCGMVCPEGSYCGDGRCLTGEPPPPACEPPRLTCRGPREELFCTDPYRDPTNCGACGLVCPKETYCKEGKCLDGSPPPPVCYPPMMTCTDPRGGSFCTDPLRDPANCGQCGNICQENTHCEEGRCVDGAPPPPACDPPMKVCQEDGKSFCTDPYRDPRNCGDCGNICEVGTTCAEGRCVDGPPPPTCEQPMRLCPALGGGSYCTDPYRDPRNCGECGNICPEGTFCGEGRCIEGEPPPPTCPPMLLTCKDPAGQPTCVDPMRDPYHCGGCEKPCPAGTFCGEGRCQEGPPPMCSPLATCMVQNETYCADFLRDRRNCGGCNIVCQGEDGCFDGKCGPPPAGCGPPRTICPISPEVNACVDLTRDPYHCGRCGNACPPGVPCQSGSCMAPPPQ